MATYEDFLNQAQNAGLLSQFSQYDLDTAKKNPEFGFSMLSYKQDYASATDQAAKNAANAAAEKLRTQYGNYTGGSDGSKYYSLGPSPGGYQSAYQSAISEALSKMQNYGDFSYGAAPTYTNRYQQQIDSLLGQVQNYGPFTWSKEEDPAYAAYAKQYRREGERATANAMAQAAAMTGGQVSSAAMTAASQAGDYYAGQLADAVPQLYENAYQRYLSDYQLLADKLGQTQNTEQMDYAKYLNELSQYNTDRSLSYDQWLQGYNMLSNNLSALQSQDQTEYQRLLDQVDFNSNRDALAQAAAAEQQALAQAQVDAMLQVGATPTGNLVSQSGYDTAYIQALDNYYKQQAAAKAQSGSKSNTRYIGDADDDVSMDYEALFAAAEASGYPKSYIANNYKSFGFTSSSGLYDEYQGWKENNAKENTATQLRPSIGYITDGSGADMTAGNSGFDYGTRYDSVLGTAQRMMKSGKSEAAIHQYLNGMSEEELTDEGLAKIMAVLNLYGYGGA